MKNLFILFSLSLSFTLACGDKETAEKSDDKAATTQGGAAATATGPEAEANAVCECMNKSLAAIDKGPAEVKKAQETCKPMLEDLKKKYMGKDTADSKKVGEIMDTCEKNYQENMRKAMMEKMGKPTKGGPSKSAPSEEVKKGAMPKGAPTPDDVKKLMPKTK